MQDLELEGLLRQLKLVDILLFCKLNDAPFVTLNDAVPV